MAILHMESKLSSSFWHFLVCPVDVLHRTLERSRHIQINGAHLHILRRNVFNLSTKVNYCSPGRILLDLRVFEVILRGGALEVAGRSQLGSDLGVGFLGFCRFFILDFDAD